MFRRLDMYDEERYIDSHLADPYDLYKPYLIRFQPKYHYKWTGADKERFPIDVYEDPYVNIDLYVKDHSEKGRVGGDFDLGYYKDLPDEMLV